MAKPEEIDDLDALIDKAVDTFFVEAPSADELDFFAEGPSPTASEPAQPPPSPPGPRGSGPSLDEAMDSLFSTSFHEALTEPQQATVVVSSGDDDTDRAIDMAVDTLFVEEPDAPPPETMELEVTAVEVPLDEGLFAEDEFKKGFQPSPAAAPPPPPPPPPPPIRKPAAVEKPAPPPKPAADYDDVMAQEIERHMRTVYDEPPERVAPPEPARPAREPVAAPPKRPAPPPPAPKRPAPPPPQAPAPPRAPAPAPAPQRPAAAAVRPEKAEPRAETQGPGPRPGESPLRKLQEAILTLEWEISKRSIAVLSSELKKVRGKFQDDMTVDFAVVAMKLVLEYLAQRMSRAHPESIRFLLEVTDLLDRSAGSANRDPLGVFHRILTRYETFKSVVRKAEGLPDRRPPLLSDLEIDDPQAFAKLVETQALTLIKAGRSLARVMDKTRDPKNLIRSFRFLVNRSINRILESTRKQKEDVSVKKDPRKKSNPTTSALR
jgi:hypothetical protein